MHKNGLASLIVATLTGIIILTSCGSDSEKTDSSVNEETTAVVEETPHVATEVDLAAGETIYNGKGLCHSCHQVSGQGLPPAFPPLAGADYLLADIPRAIAQTLKGSNEPIVVNGVEYPGNIMSAGIKDVALTDQEVVDVVNYILNSWGNNGGFISLTDVESVRNMQVE